MYEVDPNAPPAPRRFPQIMASTEAYESPVTGEKIYGRKHRAKDLAVHNCEDNRDLPSQTEMTAAKEAENNKAIDEAVDYAADHIGQ